jgi:adenosylmethionine-8-amino-7-oxononanoate aminotransferase
LAAHVIDLDKPDPHELLKADRAHIWHPYASAFDERPIYPVQRADGVRLTLADGREVVDGMASWWSAIHGYNHPVLNQAVRDQLDRMAHVMFGGLTHAPAVRLAQLLTEITPQPLQHVFFADSGSVSVEVAIKMALQFWQSQGRTKRRLLTVRGGYHGDTFGAMAVCDPVGGMHHLFADALPQHLFAPLPPAGFDAPPNQEYEGELATLIEQHRDELAAVIIEPVVQGAGGMRFYSPEYVRRLRELCDEHDVLLILDEIATGFGRTGKLFAAEHAGISPDVMCVGKAMTGGYLTMAATLCTNRVAKGISQGGAGVLMHGPTYMGNPLAAATACASIELLLSRPWQAEIAAVESALREGLAPARELPAVTGVRVLGGIGVIETHEAVDVATVQESLIERGVWLRPFRNLIYAMPPYVIDAADLRRLTEAMVHAAGNIRLTRGDD